MKNQSLESLARHALHDGFTHILAANGTQTALIDVIMGCHYHKPRGYHWAGNGAQPFANITLYDESWNQVGYYKLTRRGEIKWLKF